MEGPGSVPCYQGDQHYDGGPAVKKQLADDGKMTMMILKLRIRMMIVYMVGEV